MIPGHNAFRRRTRLFFMAMAIALAAVPAWAERVVTDQIGRTVQLPDTVQRAVILQHQTLNIAVQLDAMNRVVGVLEEWPKQLGSNYVQLAPELDGMATPGGLTRVNIEALLSLGPDVVFVTNYAPAEMIEQMEKRGAPGGRHLAA